MPILDFTEIPEAHVPAGHQDRFELFARDFFQHLGFRIIEDPSRGADGGKDIMVEDEWKGLGGSEKVRMLVSCKHKAHSGRAVSVDDELNILERLGANGCDGFVGFYSTLPSSALADRLRSLKKPNCRAGAVWYDHEKIEAELLRSPQGVELARRYFPKSVASLARENPRPADFFDDLEPLTCDHCGKVLLDPKSGGLPEKRTSIILFWRWLASGDGASDPRYLGVSWCCKGACDLALSDRARERGLISSWEDISDVCMPFVYLKWIMSAINLAQEGSFSDEALEKLKTFMLLTFHFVSRETTDNEKQRIEALKRIPSFIGGLG